MKLMITEKEYSVKRHLTLAAIVKCLQAATWIVARGNKRLFGEDMYHQIVGKNNGNGMDRTGHSGMTLL